MSGLTPRHITELSPTSSALRPDDSESLRVARLFLSVAEFPLRKQLIILLTLSCLWWGSTSSLHSDEIELFNGKNLKGWTSWLRNSQHEDPDKVFSVVNNTLRISGAGYGYLATKETFENYLLRVEFRWGNQEKLDRKDRTGKALDSGLFLHASGPHGNSHDGRGAYMAAIECNIFQGATGDFLLIRGDDAPRQPDRAPRHSRSLRRTRLRWISKLGRQWTPTPIGDLWPGELA